MVGAPEQVVVLTERDFAQARARLIRGFRREPSIFELAKNSLCLHFRKALRWLQNPDLASVAIAATLFAKPVAESILLQAAELAEIFSF